MLGDKNLTAQQFFNDVWNDAKTRTVPSAVFNREGVYLMCFYNPENFSSEKRHTNQPCLIGAQIPPEKLKEMGETFEGEPADIMIENVFPINKDLMELAHAMQKAHDDSRNDGENFNKMMMLHLKDTAKEFDLIVPEEI